MFKGTHFPSSPRNTSKPPDESSAKLTSAVWKIRRFFHEEQMVGKLKYNGPKQKKWFYITGRSLMLFQRHPENLRHSERAHQENFLHKNCDFAMSRSKSFWPWYEDVNLKKVTKYRFSAFLKSWESRKPFYAEGTDLTDPMTGLGRSDSRRGLSGSNPGLTALFTQAGLLTQAVSSEIFTSSSRGCILLQDLPFFLQGSLFSLKQGANC